jgi:predicted HNH restriction endonuclease
MGRQSVYKDSILELREQGMTYKDICKILNCSMSTISYNTISSERERELVRGKQKRESGKAYSDSKKLKERNRTFVTDYLSTHPCVDCGNSDIRVLEFDHVRGKKLINVSHAIKRTWSLKKLSEEIDKCEVRCANCHRIVTKERYNKPIIIK